MIRNFIAWVLLFVLLAFLCGLVTSGPLNDLVYSRVLVPLNVSEGDSARRALEQQFGVTFPASAADFMRANRGDDAYWIQISATPQELPALFRGSPLVTCRFAWQDNYRPVFELPRILSATEQARLTWWLSGSPTQGPHLGGECTGTDYRIFRAFVDQSNSGRWVMYMEVVRT